jgi:DNA-binding protein H-NS
MNIQTMGLPELKKLQVQIATAITNFEQRHKEEALRAVLAKAKELGLTMVDIQQMASATKVTLTRAPVKAKYRNPANKADVWSGRGRKPRWFIAAMVEGKQPEDLAIAA